MNKSNVERKAFTLVELLVVISIIAILIAVLLPSLNKARNMAKRVVCSSQERNIFYAMTQYAQTYGAFYPCTMTEDGSVGNGEAWTDSFGRAYSADSKYAYWGIAYAPYGATKKIFKCPAKKVNMWPNNNTRPSTERAREGYDYSDYGLNGFICRKDSRAVSVANNGARGGETRKLTDFKKPALTIVLQDHFEALMDFNPTSNAGDSYCIVRNSATPGDYAHSAKANLWQWRIRDPENPFYKGTTPPCPGGVRECWRHDHAGMILWLDGHSRMQKETTGEDFPCEWYTGGLLPEF